MTPGRFLRRLRDAGFRLRTDDGDLVVSPGALLTASLADRIRARKSELLCALEGGDVDPGQPRCADCGQTLPLSGVRCPDCRESHPEATCASCGADIDGPDLATCDLCRLEAAGPSRSERAPEPDTA